jgi:hypothetical protein
VFVAHFPSAVVSIAFEQSLHFDKRLVVDDGSVLTIVDFGLLTQLADVSDVSQQIVQVCLIPRLISVD